jgi:hypothetical protein
MYFLNRTTAIWTCGGKEMCSKIGTLSNSVWNVLFAEWIFAVCVHRVNYLQCLCAIREKCGMSREHHAPDCVLCTCVYASLRVCFAWAHACLLLQEYWEHQRNAITTHRHQLTWVISWTPWFNEEPSEPSKYPTAAPRRLSWRPWRISFCSCTWCEHLALSWREKMIEASNN